MKTKYFSMYGKAVDAEGAEHIVTIVGKYEQKTEEVERVENMIVSFEDDYKEREGVVVVPYKQTKRSLKLGYAICHPNDEFDEAIGIKIAKKRINRGDYIGEISTTNITMLNDDQCNLNVFGELNYIINNLDKYLPTEE